MFAHDMTEQLAIGYCECTLGGVEFEVRFITALQATVQVTDHGTEDCKVIQKYLHEPRNEFIKYFHEGMLESNWYRLEAENHDHCHVNTLVCEEGCFFLIFLSQPYLIVPAKPI